jgi:uncharacterized protein (TIGR00255 family)
MTGYGRAEVAGATFTVTVEARSLNHRHLDITLKLPRSLAGLELQARRLIQAQVQRGRLEVGVDLRSLTREAGKMRVDEALARQYIEQVRALAVELGVIGTPTVEWLLERPGVLVQDEPEALVAEEVWPHLAEALTRALAQLTARREAEGKALAGALTALHDLLAGEVERMAARVPAALERRTARLRERIRELLEGAAIDEGRLAMEVALWAEKTDITEELGRLRAHLDQFAGLVKEGGAVGRTLEFLIQEMHREVNTVASKADDLKLSQSTIAAKGLIEKLREQVQNIE